MDSNQLLLIIILAVMAVAVIAIIIFVTLKSIKRGMEDAEKPSLLLEEKMKIFAGTLTDFYTAIGGTKNVTKIDLDKEKNFIIVSLVDPNNANNVDVLKKYGLFKSEIIDLNIYLYFLNSEEFYNSLLGK